MDIPSFFMGILASVLAGLFLPSIREVLLLSAHNLWRIISGKQIDLTGTWEAIFYETDGVNTSDTSETIQLKQRGWKVLGTGTTDNFEKRHFKYEGEFYHGLIFGKYEKDHTERGSLEGRGLFMLEISGDRKELNGFCSWYDRDTKRIENSEYVWRKK